MALVVAGATACGSSSDDSDQAAQRDQLVVAITADAAANTGFAPRTNANLPGRRLMIHLYDGLVERNYYDPSKPFDIVPGLATDWSVSEDGLTWTFNLREGVTFTDGTPFNADAVIFNLDTLLKKDFEYYDEPGAAAASRYTSYIKSYSAPDESTVQLVLKAPFGGLLDEWSLPTQMYIISPAAIQKYGIKDVAMNPVGTGPFKLQSYTPGQSIILERNDDYFRGAAKIKTLILRPIPDPAARAAALQAGQVQIAEDINIQYQESLKNNPDLAVSVAPSALTVGCWLDAKSGPTQDPRVREAVSLAINRQQINDLVYAGEAEIPNGYFTSRTATYIKDDPELAYDPDRAKQLLAESGQSGAKFIFQTSPSIGDPRIWTVVAENLRAIGLDAQQKDIEAAAWSADYRAVSGAGPGTWTKSLDQIGINAICSTIGTDSLWSFYTLNAGHYDDADITAEFDKARQSTTTETYEAALMAASHMVTGRNYYLFAIGQLSVNGVASNVEWASPGTQTHSFYSAHYK